VTNLVSCDKPLNGGIEKQLISIWSWPGRLLSKVGIKALLLEKLLLELFGLLCLLPGLDVLLELGFEIICLAPCVIFSLSGTSALRIEYRCILHLVKLCVVAAVCGNIGDKVLTSGG
jgi:hypothetical protein